MSNFHAPVNIGKQRRLSRLLHKEKMLLVPLDDSLIVGPMPDFRAKVSQIVAAAPDAILGYEGLFTRMPVTLHVPAILNITASTKAVNHTCKTLVGSVEHACVLGMDAVAVHVNITSKYEQKMLTSLAKTSEACHRLGMPLLAIVYPRTERSNGDYNYDDLREHLPEKYCHMVKHCGIWGQACNVAKLV